MSSIPNFENFPFQVGLKGQNLVLGEKTPISAGFAHFKTKKDVKDYLLPSRKDIKKERFIDREVNYSELLHFAQVKTKTTFKFKRNLLTGELDYKDYSVQMTIAGNENASNSISTKRDVGKDFVRGTSTSIPFAPGGFDFDKKEKAVKADTDLDELLEGLSSIPPRFERGIEYGNIQSENLDFSTVKVEEFLSSIDETPASEPAALPKVNDIIPPTEIKDVDDLLPETSELPTLVPKPEPATKNQWVHMVDVNQDFPEFYDLVPELAHVYPFELDTFQKRAVYHLENSQSVFVAAHTSAGKTVVAEYAIALSVKHMTKTIYTSPIKALSNQKYRDFKRVFDDVGILTGDIQINPNAACVVMTTEILRSMLYRGADLIRDVEFVIFDEVHYINDSDRGVVWEEVIIMLPPHITLILLSATVPNTREFAEWVGRTKKQDVYVISTSKRPVPLEHYVFAGKDMYKIVDANKNFLTVNYKKAHEVLNPVKEKDKDKEKEKDKRGRPVQPVIKYKKPGNSSTQKNLYTTIINFLNKKNLLPCIIFSFSKKKCEEYSQSLTNMDLTAGKAEKSKIHSFIQNSLACLNGSDKELPQVLRLTELLLRGIAVHHSGLLPILKEIVEILFTRGLVKVLFCTETFAMGVNAPARTVVFSMIRKHDGSSFRQLLPGEYTQMAGRAGRRGLDDTGVVIITNNGELQDELDLRTMILGKPTKLESQFRVTYSMILNLLRVEAIKVEDMIKRSFSENDTQKGLPEQERQQLENMKKLSKIEKVECSICDVDISKFYEVCYRILTLGYMMQEAIVRHPVGMKLISTGRIVLLNNQMYRNAVGVILKTSSVSAVQTAANASREITGTTFGQQNISNKDNKTFWVFILTEKHRDGTKEPAVLPFGVLDIPKRDKIGYQVESIAFTSIVLVTTTQIKVNPDEFVATRKKSDMEALANNLYEIGLELQSNLQECDWSKIRDMDFQESYREKTVLMRQLPTFQCMTCPNLIQHYGVTHQERKLQEQLAALEHNLSDLNLEMLPDYHQRIEVLKELNFIDQDTIVQIKGRVACEINTADELVLTELILDNFFTEYDPAEIVALLSCFVFQEKSEQEPVLTVKLERGVEKITEMAIRIARIQKSCGLDVIQEEAVASLKFGLVEVVYEWARGLPFKHITDLTDVLEGSIVRCIVRLNESCREVASAARLIGDTSLYRKMDEASELIRRDIVFAASLYF